MNLWCEKKQSRLNIVVIRCKGCDLDCDNRGIVNKQHAIIFARALSQGNGPRQKVVEKV